MKKRLREKIMARRIDAAGRTVFVNVKTGKRAICRMDRAADNGFWDDPITIESGCASEFAEDWSRQDRRDGCPACIERAMP